MTLDLARRRHIALAESRALRLLHRAHGRTPRTTPTRWDWAYCGEVGQ